MASDKDIITEARADGERRHIGSTIEIKDASGKRIMVQLDELCAADRALVEQYGYKPVSRRASRIGSQLTLLG